MEVLLIDGTPTHTVSWVMVVLLECISYYIGSQATKLVTGVGDRFASVGLTRQNAFMENARVEQDPVPAKIRAAEEWRLLGEELRRLSPEVFDRVLADLVLANTSESGDDQTSITQSYFCT